jgi:hypothetical protein
MAGGILSEAVGELGDGSGEFVVGGESRGCRGCSSTFYGEMRRHGLVKVEEAARLDSRSESTEMTVGGLTVSFRRRASERELYSYSRFIITFTTTRPDRLEISDALSQRQRRATEPRAEDGFAHRGRRSYDKMGPEVSVQHDELTAV